MRPVITPDRISAHDPPYERVAMVHNGGKGTDYRSARVSVLNYNGDELRIEVDQLTLEDDWKSAKPGHKVMVDSNAKVYVNGVRIWPPRPHAWTPIPTLSNKCASCGQPRWFYEGQQADDWHTSYPAAELDDPSSADAHRHTVTVDTRQSCDATVTPPLP